MGWLTDVGCSPTFLFLSLAVPLAPGADCRAISVGILAGPPTEESVGSSNGPCRGGAGFQYTPGGCGDGRFRRDVDRVPRADEHQAIGPRRAARSAARRHPRGAGPKKYGPNVRFELDFDELKGTIRSDPAAAGGRGGGRPQREIVAGRGPLRGSRLRAGRHAGGGRPLRGVRPAGGAGRQAADHPAGAGGRAEPGSATSSPTRSASCCRARSSRSSAASS